MAGERYAKITIQAMLSHNDNERGTATTHLAFQFGNQTIDVYRGGQPGQFVVPDPDGKEFAAGEQYALLAVQNMLNVLGPRIFALQLPYYISAPHQVGTIPDPNASGGPPIPVIEFSITATDYAYGKNFALGFSNPYTGRGWAVTETVTNISPVFGVATVTDATIFGAADGAIHIETSGGDGGFQAVTWEDGIVTTDRRGLRAGRYTCVVTAGYGGAASTALTVVVGSDSALHVTVNTTTNRIALTVSGGRAPYAFLWDDGPTTPTRQGLLPDTYRCRVTDSHGASQLVEVTLSAFQFYWSQNPITLPLDAGADYRLDPTTKPKLSFLCEVWLEKKYGSDVYEQVGTTLEQPADRDGRTAFQVQALLAPFLSYHVPATGSNAVVERAGGLFRRFYLRHAEQYGLVPVPAASIAIERSYVVLGGLSFYEAQARTWFTSYQRRQLPFLTWEPATKAVFADQPEYLYYMVQNSPGSFSYQARVVLSDGTELRREYAGWADVLDNEVYCLPVGYQDLGLAALAPADTLVVSWEVQVIPVGGGAALSETRRYMLDRRHFPYRRYFLFATSLGGMATYAALGQTQLDAEVTGAEAALVLPPTYDPQLGDTLVQDRALRPVVKVASGPRTRAHLLASQDLLLSRRVLLRQGPRWLPGFIKTKTQTLLVEGKPVQTQEFDFYLPTERSYTPPLL